MNPSDLKFEIGHVLFIDIVGYSKLLINRAKRAVRNVEKDRARNRTVPDR